MEIRQAISPAKEFVSLEFVLLATSATRRVRRAEELYHDVNVFMKNFHGENAWTKTDLKVEGSVYHAIHLTQKGDVFDIDDIIRRRLGKRIGAFGEVIFHQMTFQEQGGQKDWLDITEETGDPNTYTTRTVARRFGIAGKKERLDNTAAALIHARRILDRVMS